MSKNIELIGITAGGVFVAGALLWSGTAGALAIALGLALVVIGFQLGRSGEGRLPQDPELGGRLLSAVALTYVAMGALLAAIPFYGAAKLPNSISVSNRSAAQVLAVVLGFAIVEVTKAIAIDDEVIETKVSERFQTAFSTAYMPQLSRNGGPIPEKKPDGTPTDVYLAVAQPNRFDGWGPVARKERAAALKRWIVQNHPVWKPNSG